MSKSNRGQEQTFTIAGFILLSLIGFSCSIYAQITDIDTNIYEPLSTTPGSVNFVNGVGLTKQYDIAATGGVPPNKYYILSDTIGGTLDSNLGSFSFTMPYKKNQL